MNNIAAAKTVFVEAQSIGPKLVEWRRHLHRNPELGFQEYRTQEFIAQALHEMGLRVQTGIGWPTSVVADLGEGEQAFAIRADMDGLPVMEANTISHISNNQGVMHACGHDAHMSMALGAAYILSQASGLPGRVRFVFQPAEETSDETGKTGSDFLVQGGALDKVSNIIALHVDPEVPIGSVALSRDLISAAVSTFTAEIIGSGTHVASPEKGLNPIWLLAQALPTIYSIPSTFSPSTTCIITVTVVNGGNQDNIIPDKVTIAGAIRCQDESVRNELHQALEKSLSIVKLWGGDYRLQITSVCRAVNQDPDLVRLFLTTVTEILGTETVQEKRIGLLAEDFGTLASRCKGAMLWVGIKQDNSQQPLHSPRFDIDERVLPIGTAILASMALNALSSSLSI